MIKEEIKKHLIHSHGAESLKRWFDPLSLKLASGRLEVGFPHNYFAQWFKTNYSSILEDCVSTVCGDSVRIRYIIRKNQKDKVKQEKIEQLKQEITTRKYLFGKTFTFDSFLLNTKNYFPWISAKEVAGNRRIRYNPFIVCGDSSTGKSHLLRALANQISISSPSLSIFFGDVDKLRYLYSTDKEKEYLEVRNSLLTADVFVLDDIQALGKSRQLQDELVVLFDSFHDAGKQMVFSCTGKLADLKPLSQKLRSRFNLGLIVNLEPPDFDIRSRYIVAQSRSMKMKLTKEQIFTLAQKFKNMRQIQGALLKLHALKTLVSDHIDDQQFRQVIETVDGRPTRSLSWETVVTVVAEHFSITPQDILSLKRHQKIAYARQVSAFLCRELLGFSFPKLGSIFGGRDHSTMLHGYKKIKRLQKDDPETNKMIVHLKEMCRIAAEQEEPQ
ncbi:MAG: DnaA ATPase domain-containing protein [Desulfovibrionales bacterium]